MNYKIATNKEDFFARYLMCINGVLGLSKKEILILSEFIKIQLNYPDDPDVIFSNVMRKRVLKKLGITYQNLNNYVKLLRNKNAIIQVNGHLEIPKKIIPKLDKGKSSVGFNFEITNG